MTPADEQSEKRVIYDVTLPTHPAQVQPGQSIIHPEQQEPRTVTSVVRRPGGFDLTFEDGSTLEVASDQTVDAHYAEAVRAHQLREGDLVERGHHTAMRVTNLSIGSVVQMSLFSHDVCVHVECDPDEYFLLSPAKTWADGDH